jgi:hypothetical protein
MAGTNGAGATGFCDFGNTGVDALMAGLADDGAETIGGTRASGTGGFTVGAAGALLGDVRGAAFDRGGAADGLFEDETAGFAFSDIANGEI